jgi:hypothetical protein
MMLIPELLAMGVEGDDLGDGITRTTGSTHIHGGMTLNGAEEVVKLSVLDKLGTRIMAEFERVPATVTLRS